MFSVWWRKLATEIILKFTSSFKWTNLLRFLIHNKIEAKTFKTAEQLLPVYVSFPQVCYNPGFLLNCFKWELRLAQPVSTHGLLCEFLQQWAFDGHTPQTWERNPERRLSYFYGIVLHNPLWRFGSCRYELTLIISLTRITLAIRLWEYNNSLDWVNWLEKTHPEGEQHFGLCPGLNEHGKGGWAQTFISLCFLKAESTWPAASGLCCKDPILSTLNCEPS